MLVRSKYSGSSFSELLDVEFPHLRFENRLGQALALGAPGAGPLPAAPVPHGTTVLALKYSDGVIVAGDRLATEGYRVASRDVQKVFTTDSHSLIAIAGAAGPCIEMAKLLRIELEHYEKIEGDPLELEGKANKLSQMIRANLPAAMQGFVVVPLFAGYDERRDSGRVFSYDATGGRYEESDFQTNGSGGVHARNWIKAQWREGMSREDAVDLALRSLFAAADEDAATGGPDLIRHIFPSVAVINRAGYRTVENDEIARRSEGLLGGREEGAGL